MSLYIPITFSQIPELRSQRVSEFEILNVLRRVALKYTPIIQRATPVDTGRLRRSMRVELLLDNNGLAITSEVFYAGFVEFGTKKMRPRLFAQQYVPDIVSEVLAGLGQLGTINRNRTIRQFDNDEAGLYSGITNQSLTNELLGKVINNLVRPSTVGQIRIEPSNTEELQILNEVVR